MTDALSLAPCVVGRTPNPAVVALAPGEPPPELLDAVRRWLGQSALLLLARTDAERQAAGWGRLQAHLDLIEAFGTDHNAYIVDGVVIWARFGGTGLPNQVVAGPAWLAMEARP